MTQDTTGNLQADLVKKVREDFGDPAVNPESNPNSLLWGIDNWIHTTHYKGRFRLRDNQLEYEKTPSLGQWGISMDNYGRIYQNSNENPVDYISSHYYMRNDDLIKNNGVYKSIYKNKAVWPVRPTTGVNHSGGQPHATRAAKRLTEVILRSGTDANVNTVLNWIGDEDRPLWQRRLLLARLEEITPEPSPYGSVRLFKLDQKPTNFLAAADSGDKQLAKKISKLAKRLDWPGKPNAVPPIKPLTAEEEKRFALGKKLFSTTCASCHQEDGRGMKVMAPSLVDSKWVLGTPLI